MAYWFLVAFLVGLVLGFALAVFVYSDTLKESGLNILRWTWPCLLIILILGLDLAYESNVLKYILD